MATDLVKKHRRLRRSLHVEQEIGPAPDPSKVRVETHALAREERPDGSTEEIETEATRDHSLECPWVSTGVKRTVVRRS